MTEHSSSLEARPQFLKLSPRVLAFFELIIFVAIALGSKALISIVTWRFAGPISLIFMLGLLVPYLRIKGESWNQLGLKPLKSFKSVALIIPQTILGFVAILATGVLMGKLGETLGISAFQAPSDGISDRFGQIQGSFFYYIVWVLIAWIAAGFGEELVFRGFLITRFERVMAGIPFAPILGVIAAALLFGMGHFYYQGLRGLIVVSCIGFVLGCLWLVYKRNIWPLIFAHALVDSLVFTALYLDLDI